MTKKKKSIREFVRPCNWWQKLLWPKWKQWLYEYDMQYRGIRKSLYKGEHIHTTLCHTCRRKVHLLSFDKEFYGFCKNCLILMTLNNND